MSIIWGMECEENEVDLGWGNCNDFYSAHSNGCMSSGCYDIEETTTLELSSSGLSGEIPSEIGDLINLTYLNLFSNELTGDIPIEIGNLTNLTILSLMDNQLTGEIPIEIGNLINLTYLNLYSNQLIGNIPSEIGSLTNLWYLELQMNELTGQIPSEIGNLVNLIILHLNDNNLSGEIPGNICDLTIDWIGETDLIHEIPLGYFDIDNNNLCPPYPDCGGEPTTSEECQDTSECTLSPSSDCTTDNGEIGFYDCELCCWDIGLLSWIGDGYCDEVGGCAWEGPQFNCYELSYDCGDCGDYQDNPSGYCTECPESIGDINADQEINILDIIIIVNCILSNSCDYCSDINNDGTIDILDIIELVNLIAN